MKKKRRTAAELNKLTVRELKALLDKRREVAQKVRK